MSNPEIQVSPARPYIIRAIFEWIEDNGFTPYLMVDATLDNVQVPEQYVQEGRITLSIGSHATHNMVMRNEYISFEARFGGVSQSLWVPLQAVMGIYAKEHPETMGMFFDPSEYNNYTPESEDSDTAVTKSKAKEKLKRENKAGLKVLK